MGALWVASRPRPGQLGRGGERPPSWQGGKGAGEAEEKGGQTDRHSPSLWVSWGKHPD